MLRFLLIVSVFSGAYALTDQARSTVESSHNDYRTTLANGQAVNQDGTTLPEGANIFYMQYDQDIESTAQSYSDQCVWEHSGSDYGENLFMTSEQVDDATAVQQAADSWWQELADYGMNPNLNLTDAEWNRGIGHWSQMAWANTVKVGCGVTYCPDMGTIVVCNYSPAGNYINQLIYQAGSACSSCGGSGCSSSLCVA